MQAVLNEWRNKRFIKGVLLSVLTLELGCCLCMWGVHCAVHLSRSACDGLWHVFVLECRWWASVWTVHCKEHCAQLTGRHETVW